MSTTAVGTRWPGGSYTPRSLPFALVLGVLLTVQLAAALQYVYAGAEPRHAAVRLGAGNVLVGAGLIALTVVAWDGLGIDGKTCSSLARPGDLRSGEEYVLGACLVAAALSLAPAAVAGRSRRVVTDLVAVALAATVVAAAYLASHAYSASCLSQD